MNALRLAWAYLAARPLLTLLHVLMIAIGMGTLVLVVLFTSQTEERLRRDAQPVDLVVGARHGASSCTWSKTGSPVIGT